ncbi:MAG TPA: hypothetical protein VEU08_18990 [Vicinamibacterales bacterium]|nr:hypothetical protein [Vicinamibacterales bacterium]
MAKKTRRHRTRKRRASRTDAGPSRTEFARVQRDLEIQFRRIAQMQAELDEIKRALSRRSSE